MKHINDVWNFLDQFKTKEELEKAFGEIPNKFGSFRISNSNTCEEDGYFEIENTYWDEDDDCNYAYHCVEVEH